MVALILATVIACFDEPTGPPLDVEPSLAVAFSAPDTTVLTPIGDGWIDTNKKNKAHGTDVTLEIGGADSARVLLHFDKTAIINAVGSDQLLSATLEIGLETNGGGWPGGGGRLDLYDMSAEPTESGSTWNCAFDDAPQNNKLDCDPPFVWDMSGAPPFAWPPIGDDIIFDFTDRPISFDVTDGVQDILDTGLHLGWLIKKSHEAQGGFLELGAREGTSGPVLHIIVTADTARPAIPDTLPAYDTTALVQEAPGEPRVQRRYLSVFFKPTATGVEVQSFLANRGGVIVGGVGPRYIIRFPDPGATWAQYDSLHASVNSDPIVEFAAGRTVVDSPPTTGRFPVDSAWTRDDWFNPLAANTWAFRSVRAPQAWACETGTYVNPLSAVGTASIEWALGASTDLSSFYSGYVASDTSIAAIPDSARRDLRAHALGVAGTMTADGNDSTGAAGMMWHSRYSFSAVGYEPGPDDNFHAALDSLATDSPRVIAISLEMRPGSDPANRELILTQAFSLYLRARPGTLIVKSAANDGHADIGGPTDTLMVRKALARLMQDSAAFQDQIIMVAGSQPGGTNSFDLWVNSAQNGESSAFTPLVTEIVAPARVTTIGLAEPDPYVGFNTLNWEGTSFATPLVAGVAAQILSMDPSLTPALVKDYVIRGAGVKRLDPTSGDSIAAPIVTNTFGTPHLDAYGALTLLSEEKSGQNLGVPWCGAEAQGTISDLLIQRMGVHQDSTEGGLAGIGRSPSIAKGGRLISMGANFQAIVRIFDQDLNMVKDTLAAVVQYLEDGYAVGDYSGPNASVEVTVFNADGTVRYGPTNISSPSGGGTQPYTTDWRVSPDGRWVAAQHEHGSSSPCSKPVGDVIDLSGQSSRIVVYDHGCTTLITRADSHAWSPQGNKLFVASTKITANTPLPGSSFSGHIYEVDVTSGTMSTHTPGDAIITGAFVTPNDSTVMIYQGPTSGGCSLHLWQVDPFTEKKSVSVPNPPRHCAAGALVKWNWLDRNNERRARRLITSNLSGG